MEVHAEADRKAMKALIGPSRWLASVIHRDGPQLESKQNLTGKPQQGLACKNHHVTIVPSGSLGIQAFDRSTLLQCHSVGLHQDSTYHPAITFQLVKFSPLQA